MDRHRLDQGLADGEARVERGIRVLEHHLDAAADRQQLVTRQLEQVAPVEHHLPAGRAARRLVQAKQREAHRRLARARLADHAQRVPAPELEAGAAHRLEFLAAEHAALQPEALREPGGLDDHRRVRVLRLAGVRRGAARDVVVDDHQPRAALLERGTAGEQRLGVAVLRVGEDLGDRALLAHRALAHHHHVVGDLAHHTEVVADEQHAHAVLVLQPGEQLHDLALDRHVERGGGLVGDQQLGLAGKRHRDHHALLLASRELVRIRLQPPPGLGQAHLEQQLLGAHHGLLRLQAEVLDERLADLVADGEHRVQRRHRVLEDARDVAPAQRLQLGERGGEQVAAHERDVPMPLGVVGQQVEDRHRRHALARARLAHQRDGAVLGHVEADAHVVAADGLRALHDAVLGAHAEGDPQVLDRKQHEGVTPVRGASGRARRAARR